MITATVQMKSKALRRHVSYTAIIPDPSEAGPAPIRFLYQLHGASDDHAAWLYRSNLVRYVATYPFLVHHAGWGVEFLDECRRSRTL